MEEHWAHVRQGDGRKGNGWISHDLATHLREVAKRAGEFAAPFASAEWGWLAGLWHDLGKFQPDFQGYLRKANGMDAHFTGRRKPIGWPMEAWKQIRASVRATRTEKSTNSASCARTDAPPISGGRGLKLTGMCA